MEDSTEQTINRLIEQMRTIDYPNSEQPARALVALGEPAVLPLLRILTDELVTIDDENEHLWLQISDILTGIGQPAVGPLIEVLNNHDRGEEMRANAAEILGDIGDRQAVEPLIQLLHDEDGYLRGWAATALGQLQDRRATEPLIEALKQDDDCDVRFYAAIALGQLADQQAIEALSGALSDEASDVRREAAKALAMLGDPRAIPALLRCWERESIRTHEGRAVKGVIAEAVDSIRKRVPSDDVAETWYDLLTLGELQRGQVIEDLLIALRESHRLTRYKAAVGLGLLGDPRAVEPLLGVLLDEDADLRWYAAEALGRLGDERALPALIWIQKNDIWETAAGRWVQNAAASAIAQIRQRSRTS